VISPATIVGIGEAAAATAVLSVVAGGAATGRNQCAVTAAVSVVADGVETGRIRCAAAGTIPSEGAPASHYKPAIGGFRLHAILERQPAPAWILH
jgi:hypothetical protein